MVYYRFISKIMRVTCANYKVGSLPTSSCIFFTDHGEDDGGMTLLQKLAAQSGAEMRDVDPDTGALRKRRPRGSALKQAKTLKNLEGK